jgi:hypothetical protein
MSCRPRALSLPFPQFVNVDLLEWANSLPEAKRRLKANQNLKFEALAVKMFLGKQQPQSE